MRKRFGRPSKRRIGTTAAIVLLVAAALVMISVGWVGSERAVLPVINVPTEPKNLVSNYDLPIEEVHFVTEDGVTILAWFLAGSRRDTIIVVHGFRSTRDGALPEIDLLHGAGYNVLAPTLRGSAEVDRRYTTLGLRERLDVQAAIRYAEQRPEVDPGRIALYGGSPGASTVIMTAALEPNVVAVVADSPYRDIPSLIGGAFEHFIGLPAFPFGPVTVKIAELRADIDAGKISPLYDAAKLNGRPLLVIHGLEDDIIHYTNGIDIFRNASQPKSLWLVPGAGHTTTLEVDPEEFERRVIGFFNAAFEALDEPG